MPLRYKVRGGRALKGTIRPAGNKNAALPILAATLLADGPCELENVPRIRDVESMLELLAHLGASVEWFGPNAVRIDTQGCPGQAAGPEALRADPRVDPARRADAGALRPGHAFRRRAAT